MTATLANKTLTGQLVELTLDQLHPSDDNPRRNVGDVVELAMSIKSMGIIEPLIVTPNGNGYIVVAGHRRLAAAELVDLDTVPCIVRDLDDQERLAAMLVENLQRTDLAPLEEAGAFRRLVDEFGMTQRKLSEKVGRSQGHISKRLALLQLPAEVQADVDSGGITIADAVELAKLGDEPERIRRVLDRATEWRTVEACVELELERKQRDDEISELVAVAEAEGLRVIALTQTDDYGHNFKLPKGHFRLERSPQYGSDVLGLDPKKHATEDCHAIAIHPRTKECVAVCTNRKNHPNAKTPEERAQSNRPATRAQAHDDRGELDEAERARHAFVRELFARKTAISKPEALSTILAGVITMGVLGDGLSYAVEVLGLIESPTDDAPRRPGADDEKLFREYADRGERELQRAALAIVLGEADASCTNWGRGWDATAGDYLALLIRQGYALSKAERAKLPKAAR